MVSRRDVIKLGAIPFALPIASFFGCAPSHSVVPLSPVAELTIVQKLDSIVERQLEGNSYAGLQGRQERLNAYVDGFETRGYDFATYIPAKAENRENTSLHILADDVLIGVDLYGTGLYEPELGIDHGSVVNGSFLDEQNQWVINGQLKPELLQAWLHGYPNGPQTPFGYDIDYSGDRPAMIRPNQEQVERLFSATINIFWEQYESGTVSSRSISEFREAKSTLRALLQ